jgi:Zn-dependent protease/CBS domain-containing protein
MAERTIAITRGLHLCTLAGVRVRIDPSWLLVFFLVLWSLTAGYFPRLHPGYDWVVYGAVGALATLLFFGSVLLHEMAHAVVANRVGNEVRQITLFVFGGMSEMTGESRTPAAEAKIAGVGPLASIALGALFWLVAMLVVRWSSNDLIAGTLGYLATINLALAAFNLLPGFPLDGGRLLRAWFWHRSGDLAQATARAARWGAGVAIGLMVFGALEIFAGGLLGGFWLILIGLFLRGAADAGYRGMLADQILADARVRDVMVRDPVTIPAEATVADAIEESFLRHGYGGYPVARDGTVVGLVALSQVRQCPAEERSRRRVDEVMRPLSDDLVCRPDETAAGAVRRMVQADTGRLVVLDGGRVVGLLTRSGIARYVQLRAELVGPTSPAHGKPATTGQRAA